MNLTERRQPEVPSTERGAESTSMGGDGYLPLERDRHDVATSTYGNHFRLTTMVGKMTAPDQQTIA